MRHHSKRHIKGVEVWFVVLLWALLFGPPCQGQDFDRLFIRPYFDFEVFNFRSGIIEWAQSDGWPTADPETIGLRAPESGVTSYTMTFGAALPGEKTCIKVDATGQWYYEACGGGEGELLISDVILPDNTSGNSSCSLGRDTVSVTGHDPFWLTLVCAAGEHAQWLMRIPAGFTTAPHFYAYTSRSTTGADDFSVKVRCTMPDNNEDWTLVGWSGTFTDSHSQTNANKLEVVDVDLTTASIEENELCLFDFSPDDEETEVYHAIVK